MNAGFSTGKAHLIQQSVGLRIHFRELPKCFISNEADLMAILDKDMGKLEWVRGRLSGHTYRVSQYDNLDSCLARSVQAHQRSEDTCPTIFSSLLNARELGFETKHHNH